ncbi:hypothetical protein KB1_07970 [Cutibacterium modestum]|uniref:Uncharacterized protein n=1 Tax=Cutibacterium modestum TaxID=2559073 RepID=A0AAD1KN46_9ACTN|nr:hypothetical protein KB1_07970 [Cutibacterium modestum]
MPSHITTSKTSPVVAGCGTSVFQHHQVAALNPRALAAPSAGCRDVSNSQARNRAVLCGL